MYEMGGMSVREVEMSIKRREEVVERLGEVERQVRSNNIKTSRYNSKNEKVRTT